MTHIVEIWIDDTATVTVTRWSNGKLVARYESGSVFLDELKITERWQQIYPAPEVDPAAIGPARAVLGYLKLDHDAREYVRAMYQRIAEEAEQS